MTKEELKQLGAELNKSEQFLGIFVAGSNRAKYLISTLKLENMLDRRRDSDTISICTIHLDPQYKARDLCYEWMPMFQQKLQEVEELLEDPTTVIKRFAKGDYSYYGK